MEYTGERVIPEYMDSSNGMLQEHLARYNFAKKFVSGRVLDFACGVGYGADILLEEIYDKRIEYYLGMDYSGEAIEYAQNMYGFRKTEFVRENVLDRSLAQRYGKFDTILSFETIEHLEKDEAYLNNTKKLLHKRGTLIISTPYGRGRDQPCSCPFHFRQYRQEEFIQLLENCGFEVELYGQHGQTIEKLHAGKNYFLMVALCRLTKF